jgi:hypothetical protein
MFRKGFPGAKESREPEFAGFATSCARVLSVHQGGAAPLLL